MITQTKDVYSHYHSDILGIEIIGRCIEQGFLPVGKVDTTDVTVFSDNILKSRSVKQIHFNCGSGGWPLALKKGGWHEHLTVWTNGFYEAWKNKFLEQYESFLDLVLLEMPNAVFCYIDLSESSSAHFKNFCKKFGEHYTISTLNFPSNQIILFAHSKYLNVLKCGHPARDNCGCWTFDNSTYNCKLVHKNIVDYMTVNKDFFGKTSNRINPVTLADFVHISVNSLECAFPEAVNCFV